jgi:cobaltochelatase CobN
MHLKLDPSGPIDDGDAARDLGLDTADIVVVSAADSDLTAFAAARTNVPDGFPSVQLTNLLALAHPLSVDTYVERTLCGAKIVLLRMLGGEAYWPHGVASLRADALARGTLFACIPGELTWDAPLAGRGTVAPADTHALWRYCVEGGVDNAGLALRYAAHLIGRGERPPAARPTPAAGFWPAEPTHDGRPAVPILFYRALVAGAATAPIEALASALTARGLLPLPIFLTSLKDERSAAFVRAALAAHPPDAIINATAFATATAGERQGVLASFDCPVLQIALAGTSRAAWDSSPRGLSPRDLAMYVVMPEVDGRLFANVVAFKERSEAPPGGFAPVVSVPLPDRVDAAADLAAAWVRLRRTAIPERRIAIVLANYPNRDGRLANGVGLDTPESMAGILVAMAAAGYVVADVPRDNAAIMALLSAGPTNALADRAHRRGGIAWPVADYEAALGELPAAVRAAVMARWGEPAQDPHVADDAFRLGLHRFGNLVVGIQPARGYDIDPKSSYHDPDLVPPHHYLAFYLYLRRVFASHAVIHLGKHGNLEWLPGKSTGLSAACLPEAILGRVPHLYPFIVNDPGEGIQAKRRTSAVIVDHLTPPLTRAELHGELSRLESLVDEYALAADLDPGRADTVAEDVLSLVRAQRLDLDLGLTKDTPMIEALRALDAHLCDLKELQIRDGLHVFGRAPSGSALDDLVVSIVRLPRSEARPEDASLHRALAADLGLGDFDPLTRDFAIDYDGPRPAALIAVDTAPWRTAGDAVERIERLALALVSGTTPCAPGWTRTAAVLGWIDNMLRPALAVCGDNEMRALLAGMDGRFVPPGPSGAPTRGRPDVLPTGKNFFAVDPRALPTEAAWRIGRLAAEQLVALYWQEEGEWPRSIALSAWGTANMRTGGDDIAQVLALIGARPVWESGSGRVTGFAVTPLSELGRPRIDVTFRVSGLFRDAFPTQMDLVATAVRAIADLDEPAEANPIAAAVRRERRRLEEQGLSEDTAHRRASHRVFGSKPGGYGAGLQALIDEGGWERRDDLAEAYLAWGGYAYGGGSEGAVARDDLARQLSQVDLVAQAQDNREHDILDSDDYYQFMGGLAATVATLKGRPAKVAHIDTSHPEAPVARPLSQEIARVVRGRATNPKWIAGVMRHGYKGAFEIAATVDYLFGFAASTDAVADHHFDQLFAAYLEDERVRAFMRDANPAALAETAARFAEAMRRGLWRPRSNRAADLLAELMAVTINRRETAA